MNSNMSQVVRKEVTDSINRMPMAIPDERRVIDLVVKNKGSAKLSGASWLHFGSEKLIKMGVLEQRGDTLVYGPFFEDYLISQAMAEQHLAYSRQFQENASEDVGLLSAEDFIKEFSKASASRRMDLLATHLVSLMEKYDELSEAYRLLEELVDGRDVAD